jgi:hypothetical protein
MVAFFIEAVTFSLLANAHQTIEAWRRITWMSAP